MSGSMTMVLNITSHNERALAIESAKYSNALAGDAARTAFLFAVLADGVPKSEVPRLVNSAEAFVEELRQVDERTSNGRREPFRALIPVRVVNEAVHDVGGARDLADAVERALTDSSVDEGVLKDLTSRLNRVSERFASQALNAGHASIDA